MYLPTYVPTYPPTHLPTHLPTHPPTHPPTYLPTSMHTYIHTYIMLGARKPLVWRSSEWMQRWLAGVAFTVLQGRRQMTLQSRSSRHGLLHQDDFPGLAGCGFNVPSLWYKWWKLWMSFKSFCWTQLASTAVRHGSLVSLMVSCSELVMIVRGSLRAGMKSLRQKSCCQSEKLHSPMESLEDISTIIQAS